MSDYHALLDKLNALLFPVSVGDLLVYRRYVPRLTVHFGYCFVTKDGAWNDYVFKYGKWMYSLIYNAWYMVPEILLCLIAVPVTAVLMRTVWGKKIEG